ncbi:MAG: A/G-specific adenine glycosylase [Candidatus Moranbacteria bacterium]|nr:A/G-specific adenine glycosylase [Candidatus Moranbacteria bacterium]
MLKKKKGKTKKKEEKIVFIFETILAFYTENKRDLLWRKENITPYEVWVSEIMLQQTQVSRVSQYYTRFLKRFPTVDSLARASWEEFLPYYEGLGYYRRGKNMLETAKRIMMKYQGIFPRERSELEKLPGIGLYTARAVMSFAYDDPVLAWDTNFSRVLGRFLEGTKKHNLSLEKIEATLKCFSLRKNKEKEKLSFKDFNAGMMDFGSLVCIKNPQCEKCPLQMYCLYFQENGKREKVFFQKKENFPTKEAQAFLILHENHKKYFSSSKRGFKPFVFPSSLSSRQEMKQFFYEKYGIILSIRPPKMKLYIQEKPTLIVYAQILSGEHNFSLFEPKGVHDILDTWL